MKNRKDNTTKAAAQKIAKKRIVWIDVAKGLAIISVIATHTFGNSFWTKLTLSFNMPLFFILSGHTLKTAQDIRDLWARTKKDILRLLAPAAIIYALTFLAETAMRGVNIVQGVQDFLNYKLHGVGEIMHPEGYVGMCWFLLSLFLARLILRLMSLISMRLSKYGGIAIGVLAIFLATQQIYLPLNLSTTLVATMFVAIGITVRERQQVLAKYKYAILAVASLIWILMLTNNVYIDMAARSFTPLAIIAALAATFVVCVLCQKMNRIDFLSKALRTIGADTMPIFIVHNLDWSFRILYDGIGNLYLQFLVRAVLVIIFAMALTYLLNKLKVLCKIKRN